MTAPVRDHHADHFPGDRVTATAEAARRALRDALAAFLPATPACADDPDAWFVGGADAHCSTPQRSAAAVAACGLCPIRPECTAAGESERHGVWGGTDRGRTRDHHAEPLREPAQRQPAGPRQRPYRVRRGRPLPVRCGWCNAAAGEVCSTRDGTPSERNHAARQRSAAGAVAA